MTFTPSRICSDHQKTGGKPIGLSFAWQKAQSDSCRWSASISTATPSEAASSHGEASPRQAEFVEEMESMQPLEVCATAILVESDAKDEGSTRCAPPEMDDAPLGVMFEDSDGDECPLSPSKSARRRLRRRRQREALKAAMRDMQQGEELEVLATTSRCELEVCNATAAETTQTILVTSPKRNSPHTPGVLSTNPCSDSPNAATSTSAPIFRTAPLFDASNRYLPSKTYQCTTPPSDASNRQLLPVPTRSTSLGQIYLNTPPCASNQFALGPTLASPCAVASNGTTTQFLASRLVVSSPCSTMAAPASVESWNASPEGRHAVDTLRMLLGNSAMHSGGDIAATLKAAAPEVYED